MVKSSRIRWTGLVARMGRGEVRTGFLWEKPEGRRPLRRPRLRWLGNIKIDLQEVGWERGMD